MRSFGEILALVVGVVWALAMSTLAGEAGRRRRQAQHRGR
jgi:hypothetical protein